MQNFPVKNKGIDEAVLTQADLYLCSSLSINGFVFSREGSNLFLAFFISMVVKVVK